MTATSTSSSVCNGKTGCHFSFGTLIPNGSKAAPSPRTTTASVALRGPVPPAAGRWYRSFRDERSSDADYRCCGLRAAVRRRAFFPAAQSNAIAHRAALRKPRNFGIHLHYGSRLAPTGGAFGPALVCGQAVWICSSACAPVGHCLRAKSFADGPDVLLLAPG